MPRRHSIAYAEEKDMFKQTCKLGNRQIFGGIDVKGPGVVLLIPLALIDVTLVS